MAVVRCPKGHYYDDVKNAVCPHCSTGEASMPPTDPKTVAFDATQAKGPARPPGDVNAKLSRLTGEGHTIGFMQGAIDMDPVVGWLVCLEGPERGRDYRLHGGQNFIGRAYGMDVVISDDEAVGRERHCSVVYEPIQNRFYAVPGEGSISYLNGEPLTASVEVNDGDCIVIGQSTLVFVPFCREGFTWL
jgi:hypothetical protein